jgi:hypothetical protein
MKRLTLLIACTLLVCIAPHRAYAQADFCYSLQDIIASSFLKFEDLPENFDLEGVGVGKPAETVVYFCKWRKDYVFPSKQAAFDKYADIASRLNSCKVDRVQLDHAETGETRLKQIDRIKLGRWSLPLDHPYGNVFIEMEITQGVESFNMSFEIANGDLTRLYTTKSPPQPRHPRGPAPATAPKAPEVPEDICSAIGKILKSPSDFTPIRGKVKNTAGNVNSYETTIGIPGSQENSVFASSLSTPYFVSRFISTASEVEAKQKYEEVKQALKACNFNAGKLKSGEKKLGEGAIISWQHIEDEEEDASQYDNLLIELTNEKNLLDRFDVELRISYPIN